MQAAIESVKSSLARATALLQYGAPVEYIG